MQGIAVPSQTKCISPDDKAALASKRLLFIFPFPTDSVNPPQLQDDADKAAASLVDDPLHRLLELEQASAGMRYSLL